jgi:hypothetical protein
VEEASQQRQSPGEPDTTVELSDGPRVVRARAATAEERPRLWARRADYDGEEALMGLVVLHPANSRDRPGTVVLATPNMSRMAGSPSPSTSWNQ